MRSKTSFFSPAIFRKNISRFYLLAILYLVAQCVALPLILQSYSQFSGSLAYDQQMAQMIRNIYTCTTVSSVVAFCGACASAMAVFSYLYSARSANMMASLPVRRESMFLSSCAAVLAVVVVSDLVALLLAFLLTAARGYMVLPWLLQWFGISLGQFILFFGIAVLCANLTGSILAMPVIYLVVNLASIVLAAVTASISRCLLYGVPTHTPQIFVQLSPIALFLSQNPWEYAGTDRSFAGNVDLSLFHYSMTTEIIIYTAVGLLLLLIAFLLHRKRAMETAGDVVAVRILRPVFKLLFTLGCGLVGGYLFYALFLDYGYSGNEAVPLICCVGVLSLVGYVLAEMMVRKSTRVPLVRTAVPAVVLSAVLMLGVWGVDADLMGVESRVPQVSEVREATVQVHGEELTVSDPENVGWITALHHTILDNKARNEDDNNNYYDFYCDITYTLFDGSTLERSYSIYSDQEPPAAAPSPEGEILDTLMNSPENILRRKVPTIEVSEKNISTMTIGSMTDQATGAWVYKEFTAAEAYELYTQCIYPDMLDGTIGLLDVGNAYTYHTYYYANEIEIWLYTVEDAAEPEAMDGPNEKATAEQRFYTYPTPDSKRTNAWLQAHGVVLSDLVG